MQREELMRKAWNCLRANEYRTITSVEMKDIFSLTEVKWSCKCRSRLKDAIVVALSRNDRALRPKYKISQDFRFLDKTKECGFSDYINMTDDDIECFLSENEITEDINKLVKKRENDKKA